MDLETEAGDAVVDCPHCGVPLQFASLADTPEDNGLDPDDEYRKPWQDNLIATLSVVLMLMVLILWIAFPALSGGSGGLGAITFGEDMSGPADLQENNATDHGAMGNPDRRRNPGNDTNKVEAGMVVSRAGEGEMSLPENSGSSSPATLDENLGSITLADLPRMTNIVMLSDSFESRLAAAGARSGDIRISLMWNNVNDIDLHVFDPRGEELFYGHKRSRSGGVLDVDRNADRPLTARPVENVYWPKGGAPAGVYRVFINHYRNNSGQDPTKYVVRVLVRGKSRDFTGSIRSSDRPRLVHEFRVISLRN
ncbi:MAG: hypothetical protein ACI9VS_000405 [Candidatus Binatia bacterium]|jgi:hypothetical protein